MMTEPNENEYTTGGVQYVAEHEPTGSCTKCAFFYDKIDCQCSPGCSAKHRADKRTIIWVVAK